MEEQPLRDRDDLLSHVDDFLREPRSLERSRILSSHGKLGTIFKLCGEERELPADYFPPMLLVFIHGATKPQKSRPVHPHLSGHLTAATALLTECARKHST